MVLHFNAHLFADSRRLVKQAESAFWRACAWPECPSNDRDPPSLSRSSPSMWSAQTTSSQNKGSYDGSMVTRPTGNTGRASGRLIL